MELYTLDAQLRRAAVIDRFESMIWTERFSAWGDFELHIFSTPEMRRLLPAGTRLSMSDSYRVMTVELVENTTDDEGRAMLKVSGRSLEAIMDERPARNTFANLITTPKWVLTGTPGQIARQIFNDILRINSNFPDDQLPFLVVGSLFPPGTIEEPDEVITIELGIGTVYKAIQELCNAYSLGFRIVRNFDQSQLFFDIYAGNDRTTLQTTLAPVVFATDLDNLTNISEVTSTANYRNVAYVFHPISTQIVTADGVSVEVEGFERRVMIVDASDIDTPTLVYTLTTDQTDAVNAAITASTNPESDASLQKLLDKAWMTQQDIDVVNYYALNAGSPLTTTQKTNLGGAMSAYNTSANSLRSALNTLLQQRGRDELAKNRPVQAFDGELPANSPFKYEIAYQLGDLLEMRNSDGITNQMRVTEQIFVSDAQGERAYPTLAIDRFITPGSWFAWDYNQTWENADGTWSEA